MAVRPITRRSPPGSAVPAATKLLLFRDARLKIMRDVVDLSEANARDATDSGNNRRVIPGLKIDHDCRFSRIGRLKGCIDQLLSLGVLPVVVRRDRRALSIVEFQEWIGKRICHPKLSERRPNAADDYGLGLITAHDVTGDKDIIALFDPATCRDVGKDRTGE